jgi:hypothetical protein
MVMPMSTSSRTMLATMMPIVTPMLMGAELLGPPDEAALEGVVIDTWVLLKTVSLRPITVPKGGCWEHPAWSAMRTVPN